VNPPGTVEKVFEPRGRLHLFAFEKVLKSTCSHCKKEKTAKKWAQLDGDWALRLCNACYGQVCAIEGHPYLDPSLDLRPGMHTLTKSFVNPHMEKTSHRDLMGVLRVFPKGWDWVVHRNDSRPRDQHPPIAPLLVIAAGGYHCQPMYIYESEYKEALADYEHGEDAEDGFPPLLAPREFLDELEPVEADSLLRLKQLHRHSEERIGFDDSEILDMLAFLGLVKPADVVTAAKHVAARDEMFERYRELKSKDEKLYSDAVNEVFNETGDHWID